MNARIANLIDTAERKGTSIHLDDRQKNKIIEALAQCPFMNLYAFSAIAISSYSSDDPEDEAVVDLIGEGFSLQADLLFPNNDPITIVNVHANWIMHLPSS